MKRILIADDHAIVREGLKQLLAEKLPQAQFHGAATISDTLELLRKHHWDMLVLDLFMPGGNGLGVLLDVRKHHPWVPVLVLSSAPEEQMGLRVLRAGASGYLNKQTAPEHLVQAVKKVLVGGRYLSPTLAERVAFEAGRGSQPLHERLSDREFEILHLVVSGQSLKEIAGELKLSVKTVRTFHARLLEKLHLHCDVDLVHYSLHHELVENQAACQPVRIDSASMRRSP